MKVMRSFLSKFRHVGFVVEDLDATINNFSKLFGIGPFKIVEPHVFETSEYIEKNFFCGQDMTLVGKYTERVEHKGVRVLGWVDNEKLPKIYSEHEYFVWFPKFYEPLCRAVVEAALCGCKVISNARTGATWFGDRIYDREWVSKSGQEFWEKVEFVV